MTRLCKELSTYLVTFYAVISSRVLSAVCAAPIARPLPEREYLTQRKPTDNRCKHPLAVCGWTMREKDKGMDERLGE